MAYKVFITSAKKDRDLVRDLAQRLETAGLEVHSVDQSGVPIKTSAKSTKDSLSNADEIFVLLTDESMDSPELMFLLGAASSMRKRVTPIVVGLENSKIPSLIKSLKYIKYPDLNRYIVDLATRTRAA